MVALLTFFSAVLLNGASLDLAPSGHLSVELAGKNQSVQSLRAARAPDALVLEWDEERDVQEIRVGFDGAPVHAIKIEYWFKNWPYPPPEMPSMEDPVDDPWQGEWLKAETQENCGQSICRYIFAPLHAPENPRAKYLPGAVYRRTLKIRISYRRPQQHLETLQAFSSTTETMRQATVELGRGIAADAPLSGWISVYNGRIEGALSNVTHDASHFKKENGRWVFSGLRSPGALTLDVATAATELPGSNDDTVVTVHTAVSSFSFKVADLDGGPVAIPEAHARVVGPRLMNPNRKSGATIRSLISLQPEQTYRRAAAEIPPLDPIHREWGGPLYSPLAADSSWQKFAFEIGGNVFLSKQGLKAKPGELKRLSWKGDRLTWTIATGPKATRLPAEQMTMQPKKGYLPIVTQSWAADGLQWQEEAFATLIHGPLSPDDKARSEQTPAVLLLKVSARNTGSLAKETILWLETGAEETLHVSGSRLLAGETLRAIAGGASPVMAALPGTSRRALKLSLKIQPGESRSFVLKLPAVTDLSEQEISTIEALDYSAQRQSVEAYWRTLVEKAAKFSVPEPRFNDFLRATIAHIHLTASKDPQTGLVMLGAASYVYDVYENESCYQILLLDALGQSADAATLLEPMLELQGSKNFPGVQTGSFAGVFHGVKISDAVDYTANGYGLDHGTVLWTLAQHYLYTRDPNWFRHAWPHMRKAIEWIEAQRKATELRTQEGGRVREYGLLPASKLEDNNDWANWFAINAFAYAGMDLTAQILTELGYPEANTLTQEAADYRADLRRSILKASQAAPVVRLQDGSYQPYVPTVPTRRFRLFGPAQMNYYARYGNPRLKPLLRLGADRDTLCGPVLLLILGVFDADEPIADWILNDWEDNETLSSGMGMNIHGMTDDRRWFSQGGMVFQANLINPIPIYLRRHEIPAAIRNLYNDFVACHYPGANQFTEEFHQWVHASGPFYKSSDEARFVGRLREMLILEDKDSLWLASGVPRRWLESRQGITVTDAQTFFGPVTYTLHAGPKARTIEADVHLPERNPAKHSWLVVRTPSKQFRSVEVNGTKWTAIDQGKEAIELTGLKGDIAVEIQY